MKNKKTLNKLLTGIGTLCSLPMLIFATMSVWGLMAIMGGFSPTNDPQLSTWEVEGPILALACVAALTTIIKMALVTVPAAKGKTEKVTTRAALCMDIITLLGFLMICVSYICRIIPADVWAGETQKFEVEIVLWLIGCPFQFMGNILGGSLTRSAIKTGK